MDVDADRAVVARQLGRLPRAFRRVAVRCPFGGPAVTEQRPYDDVGEPFPTTFWLTCPHLVAAISRVEAVGGVERWSAATAADEALERSRAEADEEQRTLRLELAAGSSGRDHGASLRLGVGGAGRMGSLKCLHAHAAFALARPGYELGERILDEVEPLWPDRCCTIDASTSIGAVSTDATTLVRQEWDAGNQALEGERDDAARYAQRHAQVDIVVGELRKRVGQTYTLAELADAYGASEPWAREAVAEQAAGPGWPRDLTLVVAAAFHRYQRGASDYRA